MSCMTRSEVIVTKQTFNQKERSYPRTRILQTQTDLKISHILH